MSSVSPVASRSRRFLLILTLGAVAGVFVLPLNPVGSGLLKAAWLACLGGAWAGLSMLTWGRRRLRTVAMAVPLIAAVPFLLPGEAIDADELRREYVRRMEQFEGTRYHWGGESSRGIDCSGLPRRALRDALLAYGLRHANGRAVRMGFAQWWHDASAQALGQGHRGDTIPLGITGTIRGMNHEGLVPGDFAVTTTGTHLVAYLGAGRWIQADPGEGAVVALDGRTADNLWFRFPVTTHRWQVLAAP